MDKTVEINEIVTFIKATREEALALAYDIGGGEVHALHIQGGFSMPAEKPVGYLVLPLKREWVGLTDDDIHDAFNYVEMVKLLDFDRDRPEWCEAFARACEARLRHRNGEKQ